jgi:hypothetical protein
MNPLDSRKKLLIAESELNRAQLVQDWHALTDEVETLADRARTIRSFASAASTLVAGLFSLRHKKSAPVAEKASWLQTILKGAGTISTFWSAFKSPGRNETDEISHE